MEKRTKRKALKTVRSTSTAELERMAAAMRPKHKELSIKLSYIEYELQNRRRQQGASEP